MGSAKDGSAYDGKSAAEPEKYWPLAPEQWKDKLKDLRNLYICKFPRIFQALFYLLKFRDKSLICERETNKLNWKKAKICLNEDLFIKIGDYWPFGAKEDNFKEYEKIKFIQNNLAGITDEQVDEFSVALGKLFRWIKLALQVRIEDVKMRSKAKEKLIAKRKKA